MVSPASMGHVVGRVFVMSAALLGACAPVERLAAHREQAVARTLAAAYRGVGEGAPPGDRDPALAPLDTQARTTPSPAPVALALVCLTDTAMLAACTRP